MIFNHTSNENISKMSEQQMIFFAMASAYFTTIPLEMIFNSKSNSSRITLFDYLQSLCSTIIFQILFGLILIGIYLTKQSLEQLFDRSMIYFILLKFFELIPILLDMINLLSIYLCKIRWNVHRYRLYLSIIFCSIRLIFARERMRRRLDTRWKRRVMIIGDFGLFILVNVTLVRDLHGNMFSILRKTILAVWILRPFPRNLKRIKQLDMIRKFRWMLSMVLMSSILILTLRSMIIDADGNFIPIEYLLRNIRIHCPIFLICMMMIFIIHQDKFDHIKIPKKIFRKCLVCLDDQELIQFDSKRTPACQHTQRNVCDTCVVQHVRITFNDDISCPEQNCQARFDYHTVRSILQLSGDTQLVERYDRYIVHRHLEQMEEFIWCANPLCQTGQLNEGGRLNTIVICYHCREKTCFQHKVQWHEGMTCEEYDEKYDPNYRSSRQWVKQHSKACPGCSWQIEKNDGCDHMTCIKCRYEFCWLCLADFQPIRRDGNCRHKNTCKYYIPYTSK